MTELLLCLLALAGLIALILKRNGKENLENFPKGPPGLPVLGNLHQMGTEPHKTFMEMKKKYGDIFSLQLGSFRAVVLNNFQDIRDALSQNAFSGRPDFAERLDRNGGIPRGIIFNVGHSWSEQRRFTLKTLRDFGFGKKSMESIVHEEVKELLETFQKCAGKPMQTQNRFNAAVLNALWTIVTGQRYSHDDPELHQLVSRLTTTVTQGKAVALYLFFPWLYKLRLMLPGSYNRMRKETQRKNTAFVQKAIDEHRSTFQEDDPPRDFIDVYLAEIKKTTDPNSSFYGEEGLKNLQLSVLDLFVAGAETTATTLSWIFLLLAMNPEKQEKMFEEIRRVVGLTRLPELNDRPMMPYTEAVIHEAMRISSMVPLSAFHATTQDAMIRDFRIPEGTVVIPNIYAAMRDPLVWKDEPEKFLPERFLSSQDSQTGEMSLHKSEALMPFSTGKRICLGMTLALDELFLFTASLFQAFRVAEDPANLEGKLRLDYFAASVLVPKPQNMILHQR